MRPASETQGSETCEARIRFISLRGSFLCGDRTWHCNRVRSICSTTALRFASLTALVRTLAPCLARQDLLLMPEKSRCSDQRFHAQLTRISTFANLSLSPGSCQPHGFRMLALESATCHGTRWARRLRASRSTSTTARKGDASGVLGLAECVLPTATTSTRSRRRQGMRGWRSCCSTSKRIR